MTSSDRSLLVEIDAMATSLQLAELVERLRWLIALRWLAVGGIVAVTSALSWLGATDLPMAPLVSLAGIVALYNLGFWVHLRFLEGRKGSDAALHGFDAHHVGLAANLQVALDLLLLTLLLHFSGGVENPICLYYVFHVAIAGMLLSRRDTFLQATLAALLISTMAALEYWGVVPHFAIGALGISPAYLRASYVLAVLLALDTTLFLGAYMSTSISERWRRRERHLLEMNRELGDAWALMQRTQRAKSQQMLKVTHQLRAPLGAAQSLIMVVSRGLAGPIPEQPKGVLERASMRIREMLDLVGDLLTLSQAEEWRPDRVNRPVALDEVARQVADLFRAQAEGKAISFEVAVPSQFPPLIGDPDGIQDIVANLVSNAIKYTPSDGRVDLAVSAEAEEAIIRVSDSGIGIPAEEIPRIFEGFYRTEQARKMVREGTGLGLPIVKAIVDAHGGSIEVKSEPGSGTTFTVRIPLSPGPLA